MIGQAKETRTEPVKLNLGSGTKVIPGYRSMDAAFGDSLFPALAENRDSRGPVIVPDNSADEVYASHILEHFPYRTVPDVLKEWVRVLKPGGWLKIAVPDFAKIAQWYLNGDHSTIPLTSYVLGSQTDDRDYHKSMFDIPTLTQLMIDAGLVNIEGWQAQIDDCAALDVSLNLMGQKPHPVSMVGGQAVSTLRAVPPGQNGFVAGEWHDSAALIRDKVKTNLGFAMSCPRIGYLDSADIITDIAHQLHALKGRGFGVFWSHSLTRSIQKAIEHVHSNGDIIDFIVTADYDTFAEADNVVEMVRLLLQNPSYDCLIPVQMKRGRTGEVLAGTDGRVDMTQGIVPINTGHFGLSVFRRRVFERLRKPWFLEVPDENGEWGEGRTDPDIYFWRQLCDQGFKAGMAAQVFIGHREEVVTMPKWVDGVLTKDYLTIDEWQMKNQKVRMYEKA